MLEIRVPGFREEVTNIKLLTKHLIKQEISQGNTFLFPNKKIKDLSNVYFVTQYGDKE